MTAPLPSPCPHCRDTMPPGFLFCRACSKDLGFTLRAELWTAESRAHHPSIYPTGGWLFAAAMQAAKSHLAQFSSAL